ncbi:GTPase family protein [Trichormus azollae]|uniref:GTPase family protein n=1 Tax=Trichormus azollae TaxID=1164 RepID=UPI003D3400F0
MNTFFKSELAILYVSPSTDIIQNYHWTTDTGEILNLCDTPGYEQVKRDDLRDLVIDFSIKADLLLFLLVTPALDPALQIDVDFLKEIKAEVTDLPIIIIVTQVDKLYPIREWQPSYIWKIGNKPKEISIREATGYGNQLLGNYSKLVVPIIINDVRDGRNTWNLDELSLGDHQP